MPIGCIVATGIVRQSRAQSRDAANVCRAGDAEMNDPAAPQFLQMRHVENLKRAGDVLPALAALVDCLTRRSGPSRAGGQLQVTDGRRSRAP